MTTKKGQGLSLNTIIIAIIVLVVLVVLVMIFTGYFGKIFTPTVGDCGSQGGKCAASCEGLGNEIQSARGCPPTGKPLDKICCGNVQSIEK